MEEIMKKILTGILTLAMSISALCACGTAPEATAAPEVTAAPVSSTQTVTAQAEAPKYVFLFIGDGMSYPQIQSTADYLGAWMTRTTGRPSPAWTTTRAPFWTAPST